MQLRLIKADVIVTLVIALIAGSSLFFVRDLNNQEGDRFAYVYFRNQLVHTFDLNDHSQSFYEIEATNGLVRIESKDGMVRVVDETSRRNICSIQGWTNSVVAPIVCLPNELFVRIEARDNSDENGLDGVIR